MFLCTLKKKKKKKNSRGGGGGGGGGGRVGGLEAEGRKITKIRGFFFFLMNKKKGKA